MAAQWGQPRNSLHTLQTTLHSPATRLLAGLEGRSSSRVAALAAALAAGLAAAPAAGGLLLRRRRSVPVAGAAGVHASKASTLQALAKQGGQARGGSVRQRQAGCAAAESEAAHCHEPPRTAPPHSTHVLGNQDAAAQVLADLALLLRACAGAPGAGAEEEDEAVQERARKEWEAQRRQRQQQGGGGADEWKPPEGQTGDGRTKLNDALGY